MQKMKNYNEPCFNTNKNSPVVLPLHLSVIFAVVDRPLQYVLAFLLCGSPVVLGLPPTFPPGFYPCLNLLKSNQKIWVTVNDCRFLYLLCKKELCFTLPHFWFSDFGKWWDILSDRVIYSDFKKMRHKIVLMICINVVIF